MDRDFYKHILIESSLGYAYGSVVTDEAANPIDLSFIEANPAFARMLGKQPQEVENCLASQLIPHIQENDFNWIASIGRVGLSGRSQHLVQHIDSVDRWLSVRASCPQKGQFVLLVTDITAEIKRFRLLEGIVDLTPILICVIDFRGNFILVNDEWTNSLGYQKQTLIGSNIFDYIHPDDVEMTTRLKDVVHEDRVIRNFVNRYRNVEGAYRVFEWRIHVSGELIYAAARDVTERVATEKQKQRELDLMNLLFDQTLTGMFMMMLDAPADWQHSTDKETLLEQLIQNLKLVRTNQAFQDQYLASEAQLIGKSLEQLFQSDSSDIKESLKKLLDCGKMSQEYKAFRSDGSPVWLRGDFHCLYNTKSNLVGFFGMQLDISERHLSEIALKKSERMYRLIAEHASDVIWVFEFPQMQFSYMSPSVFQFIGYHPEEIVHKPFDFSLHPDEVEKTRRTLRQMIAEFKKSPEGKKQWTFQVRHIKRDGSIIFADASVNFRYNETGAIEAIGVSRDVTIRRHNEDRILHLSYKDQLTGLYNRRYYEEMQSTMTQNQQYLPFSIIVCDVNGLKLTNDVFGHQVGDQLLIACAKSLLSVSKELEVVARIGGDEFVVLMPNTSHEKVLSVMETLRGEVADKRVDKTRLSVSFGCATANDSSDTFQATFKLAEDNMYRQKLMESSSYKHDVIRVLIYSLYEKGRYEREHSEHVSYLCEVLGRHMNLPSSEIDDLRLAGLLHDIGKIGISREVLNEKRPLTEQEWTQMHRHPEMGFQILRSVQNFGRIADWILTHHEQPDGKGYPQGLKDKEIPIQAKIIAVANAYDSMTSTSGYRAAPLSPIEAIEELQRFAGTQFDQKVVQTFQALSETELIYPDTQKEEVLHGSL